jgi:hypothetical protein
MTLTRDAVEKMLADATPGPWRAVGENYDAVRIVTAHEMPQPDHSYGRQTVVGSSEWTHVTDEDARLIASTPDTATALLTAWDERDALMAAVQANLLRPNYVRAEAAEAKLAERDAEIARLRAQLDSTLKDRALIMDERDALMEAVQANLLRPNYVRAEAAEARLARVRAHVDRLRHEITEASDPDFLFGAMDNVADMDVGLMQYAEAASRAIRAAIGGVE